MVDPLNSFGRNLIWGPICIEAVRHFFIAKLIIFFTNYQQTSPRLKYLFQAAKEFESELKKEPEVLTQPPPSENPNSSVENLQAAKSEDGKELEASGTKESP